MKLARSLLPSSSLCASLAVVACWAKNFCTNAAGQTPTISLSLWLPSHFHLPMLFSAPIGWVCLLPSETAPCHNGFDKHTKWHILSNNWLHVVTVLTQYVWNYSSMYWGTKMFRAGSPQPWTMNFSCKLPAAHTQRKWAAKFTPTWLLMNDISRTLE